MSPEAQRIAIAEECGWRSYGLGHWYPPGLHPMQNVMGHTLPDYLNDLNAIHEVETSLAPTEDEREFCQGLWVKYGECLVDVVMRGGPNDRAKFAWDAFTATAAQRAEAFLRAIGKWEGERK